jgi:iron(III) transport system permease protein
VTAVIAPERAEPTSGVRAAPETAERPRRPPAALVVGALVVALVAAAPLGYLAWSNLDAGTDVWGAVTSSSTLEPLARTLVLATSVAATSAAVGTGLAWLTVRTDVPGRTVWKVLAPLPLVIPSYVGAAALLAGLAPGGLVASALEPLGVEPPEISGFFGAWLVLSLFTYPYVYLPVAARLATMPPSLEESARLLGRRPLAVFASVVRPQVAPAVWAGTLLVFLYTVSDFGAVEIMRYGTLTREIFRARLVPELWLPLALVLAVVAMAVVAGERAVRRRQPPTPAMTGRRPHQVRLRRWRWPAAVVAAIVLFNALVGPLAVLGWWAVRGLSATSPTGALLVDPGALVGPAANTIGIGLVAAVVTVAAVLPVAWLTGRYRTRSGGVANTLVVSGFALPGLVIALSLVFWVLSADVLAGLYQTFVVLVVAYAVHFGAQATRAGQVAVGAVPRRLDDAARLLGAGRLRRLLTVDLPLMRPGLVAGVGLVLLSVMKELPATLVLAPPGFSTLATSIWAANDSLALAQVGLASLVLVGVSGLLTWVLVIRREGVT